MPEAKLPTAKSSNLCNSKCDRRVLDFFNNCDYVTLKKLTSLKSALFKDFNPYHVVQCGPRGNRFADLDKMMELTQFQTKDIAVLGGLIKTLEKADMSGLEIKKLRPQLKIPVQNLRV